MYRYATMACFSPFLYIPFYLFGIYAFIREKEWIRIPALMWGYGLLLTMVVVLREELYGSYPTKNTRLFLVAYLPYAFVPFIVMARVARYPVFGQLPSATTTAPDPDQTATGKKKKNKLKLKLK